MSVEDYRGDGKISGVTRIEGIDTPGVSVDLLHRPTGMIVRTTISGVGGKFEFIHLNADSAFDVIARPFRKNAVISDSRSPVRTGEYTDQYRSFVRAFLDFDDSSPTVDRTGREWFLMGSPPVFVTPIEKKFGSGSCDMNPNQDVGDASLEFDMETDAFIGTGDFTIEWFQYWRSPSSPQYQAAINHAYNSPGALNVVTGNGNAKYTIFIDAVSVCAESTPGTMNQWVHYALTRKGSMLTLWRDGIASATGSTTATIGNLGRKFSIGSYASDSGAIGQLFNGYFDGFRMTVGVSRYNEPFDVPAEAFVY